MQSFKSQICGVVGPLGENLDFFSPLGFDVKTNSDHKTQKIKLYSVRALKCYLNEINLIYGRAMATISKFSPQIFGTYKRTWHVQHKFSDCLCDIPSLPKKIVLDFEAYV